MKTWFRPYYINGEWRVEGQDKATTLWEIHTFFSREDAYAYYDYQLNLNNNNKETYDYKKIKTDSPV